MCVYIYIIYMPYIYTCIYKIYIHIYITYIYIYIYYIYYIIIIHYILYIYYIYDIYIYMSRFYNSFYVGKCFFFTCKKYDPSIMKACTGSFCQSLAVADIDM